MNEPKQLRRVLIMAGGTGGHVIPGLSVAHFLRERGVDVHWLGTPQGLEAQLVPEARFPIHFITIGGLRGKGFKTLCAAPIKIFSAVRQAQKIIKKIDPDIVLGMGGFASGPGGLASFLMRYPLVVHEQNAKAGFTNKILARMAKKVLEGFPNAFKPHDKVMTVGNPVRPEIEKLPPPAVRFDSKRSAFHLMIVGGSLGAQALNEIVPHALAKLEKKYSVEILHQSGKKNFEATKKLYEASHLKAHVVPFIDDMSHAYAWADMVICRAGALTVAELCAAGLGAIFIPFPYAVDDHQTANAHFMAAKEAALCIQQVDLSAERLAGIVKEFIEFPQKRIIMACAAYKLRRVQVTEKIFDILSKVVAT